MAEKLEVVIWGAGIQGEIVAYILSYNPQTRIRAFVDDNLGVQGKDVKGVPVLRSDTETLTKLREEGVSHGIIAIGNRGWLRESLSKRLETVGFKIISAIHPAGQISPEVRLGKGVIIDSGCNFGYNPVVGNYVLASISVTVGHDSHIEDNVELCAGVVISSRVHIGRNAYIGTGARVVSKDRGNLGVGEGAMVGAGALVLDDVPPKAVVVGVPARIIRYRTID